ncbi:MAG: hypothetical protein N4A62_05255 [Marinisporobacter sp.]|jgi:hypothetical protein|nr:hypothetical protein [Marinisporobacter sp.]
MDTTILRKFSEWLNQYLVLELPKEIKAFNFNLYEEEEEYHVQLIGSETLPEEDDDWACDEIFTTGENIFIIANEQTGDTWEEGLRFIIELVKKYLVHGKFTEKLKSVGVVGVGFVDGDIEIVYQKK